MTTANTLLLGTGTGAGLLALAGTFTWRLGVEFERAWLRALAAPPAQWEADLFERGIAEIESRREAVQPATVEAVREAALV